jgi:hypothetical protein
MNRRLIAMEQFFCARKVTHHWKYILSVLCSVSGRNLGKKAGAIGRFYVKRICQFSTDLFSSTAMV